MKYTISINYEDAGKNADIKINPTPPNTFDSLCNVVSALMTGTIHFVKTCVKGEEIQKEILENARDAFEKVAGLAIKEEKETKEGKITIQEMGENVRITTEGDISPLEAMNLLMNGLDDVIRESLEEPEKRTKLAKLIGKKLEEKFAKEEQEDDQKRTPANIC